jgi:ribosomal protein S18 acetylase RimI-like enzyme
MAELQLYTDAEKFRDAVWPFLSEDVPANNLLLLNIESLLTSRISVAESKMGAILKDGLVVGAIVETREHFPYLAKMDSLIADAAFEQWTGTFGRSKGFFGPLATCGSITDYLHRASGAVPKQTIRQMGYELLSVSQPSHSVNGHMRVAERRDFGQLLDWSVQFSIDCGLPGAASHETRLGAERALEKALGAGTRFVWEEGEQLRSMAGKTPGESFGTFVSNVYTPREQRGKGYASHLVAQLSRHILNGGAPRCLLFTDAANPTSNAIYQRIGYRHVSDFLMVILEE